MLGFGAMASAFAHAVSAVALGDVYRQCGGRIENKRLFWSWAIAASILPDADVIGFRFGIQYGDFWGHRGFSHSIVFALIFATLLVWLRFGKWRTAFSRETWALITYFFLVTASHGVLDGMTNGGLGIAFFSPFDNGRYFLPWTPVVVSPIGVASFFSEWGVRVVASEAIYIGLPCVALVVGIRLIKTLRYYFARAK